MLAANRLFNSISDCEKIMMCCLLGEFVFLIIASTLGLNPSAIVSSFFGSMIAFTIYEHKIWLEGQQKQRLQVQDLNQEL